MFENTVSQSARMCQMEFKRPQPNEKFVLAKLWAFGTRCLERPFRVWLIAMSKYTRQLLLVLVGTRQIVRVIRGCILAQGFLVIREVKTHVISDVTRNFTSNLA